MTKLFYFSIISLFPPGRNTMRLFFDEEGTSDDRDRITLGRLYSLQFAIDLIQYPASQSSSELNSNWAINNIGHRHCHQPVRVIRMINNKNRNQWRNVPDKRINNKTVVVSLTPASTYERILPI